MKITYFQDTDTLYLEFNNNPIVETQEINENTLVDLDKNGNDEGKGEGGGERGKKEGEGR